VADTGKRTKGKQQADKAAPKLPQYAPIVFQGESSRVLAPFDYKQKSSTENLYCFLWCVGRDSPSLPAANTAWPCLGRKAPAAKNSVPHCFLHAATLSGSHPSS